MGMVCILQRKIVWQYFWCTTTSPKRIISQHAIEGIFGWQELFDLRHSSLVKQFMWYHPFQHTDLWMTWKNKNSICNPRRAGGMSFCREHLNDICIQITSQTGRSEENQKTQRFFQFTCTAESGLGSWQPGSISSRSLNAILHLQRHSSRRLCW